MWKFITRRRASGIGGALPFVRLFQALLGIPGYVDDGVAWAEIIRRVGCAMTVLDIVLLIVGVPFLIYAVTPEKFWVWIKGSKTDRDSQESKKKGVYADSCG